MKTDEAAIFGTYIIGSMPSSDVLRRYKEIVRLSPADKPSERDRTVVAFTHKHPRLLPAVDAYAALFEPQSEIRRRLFIMFAILESTPAYADKFLPKDNGLLYWLTVAGVGLRAVYRVCLGLIVTRFIRTAR